MYQTTQPLYVESAGIEEGIMLTSNDYCPECGGVSHSDSPLVLEHSDLSCSFRWDGEQWKPLPYEIIERERYGDDFAADLDEAFNTLFDELDKLPKEHRTKAFDMLSKNPWFNEAERS